MRIALIYLDALASGGYPRDVRWLAGALAQRCPTVSLIAHQEDHRDGLGSARVIAPRDWRILAGSVDVAHTFGLFSPRQLVLHRRLESEANIVSPLGHLMETHLARRTWKKDPYLALARRFLLASTTFHLFSDEERAGVSAHMKSTQWFRAPLGVMPAPTTDASPPPEERYLLFFGRNDVYQKGIDLMLAGYAAARRRGLALPLVIAGRAQDNSDYVIQDLSRRLGIQEHIRVVGSVGDREKWTLLREANALVFLSRWDGPPRPIREALAVGTPVIVTPGTNLAALVSKSDAGRGVEPRAEAIAGAMLLAQDDGQVESWRVGAKALRAELVWDCVVNAYLEGYGDALATGERIRSDPATA